MTKNYGVPICVVKGFYSKELSFVIRKLCSIQRTGAIALVMFLESRFSGDRVHDLRWYKELAAAFG